MYDCRLSPLPLRTDNFSDWFRRHGLEIVGDRLVAPVFGTSVYVWTAMIGVILGALAVGYSLGGRLADRGETSRTLGGLLLLATVCILVTGLIQQPLLATIAGLNWDVRIGAVLAAIPLFGLPSLLVGMVSPHIAKIRVTSLDSTGASIGRLETFAAAGSIVGTFSCGYFLLGSFGSRTILMGVAAILLVAAVIALPGGWRKAQAGILVAIMLVAVTSNFNPPGVLSDTDTAYARYQVIKARLVNQHIHGLIMSPGGIQSEAIPGDTSTLVSTYTAQFMQAALAYTTQRPLHSALVIGGGAYVFPSFLVRALPPVQADTVEIDPGLETIASRYFNYQPLPGLTIKHADGRAYLNTNAIRYNMIFIDAFSSNSPPFQLTTKEAVKKLATSLQPDGVVAVNAIGNYRPGNDAYLKSLLATYRSVFDQVAAYPLNNSDGRSDQRTNIMIYASNNPTTFKAVTNQQQQPALAYRPGGLILTDNYAPVERLTF